MNIPTERKPHYKPKKLWWEKTKFLVKSTLNHFPPFNSFVKKAWRIGKWNFLKSKWGLTTKLQNNTRNFYTEQLYWISPQKIEYTSMKEFDYGSFKGKFIGGDWDLLNHKFNQLDIYVAFNQVILEGKRWEETIFYQRILNRLNHGEILWGCRNERDLFRRCENMTLLYQTIKRQGYKSQGELSRSIKDYDPANLDDEVTISIGRFGDILFSNGAHRLSIAKLLNINAIPVRIAVRHPEWIKLKKELYLYSKYEGGYLYQPALHPDLKDIPAFHTCEDRFRLIKDHLSTKHGNLLDIGANIGYFCHRFEDEGFNCYAIENSEKELYFLKKIKRAENKVFSVIPESILESKLIRNLHFDVILALNVFHHFLKTEEAFSQFIDLLENLQTKELIFEPHLTGDPQMEGAYRNFSTDEFAGFLTLHLKLNHIEMIGTASDGRPLYRLH